VLLKRRPRSAQDSNRSNHQQPERKHSKARNRLQSQSRQQQPLPAQHQEQQQCCYKIHHPHKRRQGGGESADGIRDACDGEGKGKPLSGEFYPAVVGCLLGSISGGIIWLSNLGRDCRSFSLGELAGGLIV
jgi:hypothetical protein